MARPHISFEFFPPQTVDATFQLAETMQGLAPFRPDFVSVTFGAGGTTTKATVETVTAIKARYGLNVAAHLTCVGASRADVAQITETYEKAGVTEIVALRGDAPKGETSFTPRADGFASSVELIAALADTGKFTLRVGAYPEPHPDAPHAGADLDWLARKFDAGAHSAITQFFFEADTFLRFRDAARARGISKTIIPGVLPIQSWEGAKRFAGRCGAQVPLHLDAGFTAAREQGREEAFAIDHCIRTCEKLLAEGVEDLHFYSLNRAQLTQEVLTGLGFTPAGLSDKGSDRPLLELVA